MPEVITLVPTWEAAARIHLCALQNPNSPDATKNGAEQEIIRLARAYDGLCADVDEESRDEQTTVNGPNNDKPYGTLKNAKLYTKKVAGTIAAIYLTGDLVSHDNPRSMALGEIIFTSHVVGIALVDGCLVVETRNTNYIIEEGRLL